MMSRRRCRMKALLEVCAALQVIVNGVGPAVASQFNGKGTQRRLSGDCRHGGLRRAPPTPGRQAAVMMARRRRAY